MKVELDSAELLIIALAFEKVLDESDEYYTSSKIGQQAVKNLREKLGIKVEIKQSAEKKAKA